jgi:preprotein translocase subunit YajC
MSFLISDALAQAAPAAQQQIGLEGMLFPLGILVFFYFFFVRPQAKRTKEQKQMLAALTKGCEVVTTGGILGKVFDLDENFVKLEVGENSFIQVQRHAIANMMPKGTYKSLSIKKPKV